MSNAHRNNAINTLTSLWETIGTSYMPHFMTPNVLLGVGHVRALSGVRIDAPEEKDKEVLESAVRVLEQDGFYCQQEEGTLQASGQSYINLNLYSLPKLKELHYTHLMPVPKLEDDSKAGVEAYLKDLAAVAEGSSAERHPGDRVNAVGADWLAGLLFGYPEPAVASMPAFWAYGYQTNQEFRRRVHESDIARASMYWEVSDGECLYDIPWFLAEHPQIIEHQSEWSRYLDDFYSSDWHQSIAQEDDFQATLTRARERDGNLSGAGARGGQDE
ncbi:hypothetical protein BRC19_02170 [Candidatus Saccharibacteria bacterium QS_5_54_17]|nr:MAG: hypothetical protein BRC19_02170 [Candidatus Saccharibacteria bacterium QS_5_54_17]